MCANIGRYEYVKDFERDEILLPNTWIVVRIDGRGFHKSVFHISTLLRSRSRLPPFLESQMDYLIYSPLVFCTFIRPSHLLHRIL
jgi:hypothetical protein